MVQVAPGECLNVTNLVIEVWVECITLRASPEANDSGFGLLVRLRRRAQDGAGWIKIVPENVPALTDHYITCRINNSVHNS